MHPSEFQIRHPRKQDCKYALWGSNPYRMLQRVGHSCGEKGGKPQSGRMRMCEHVGACDPKWHGGHVDVDPSKSILELVTFMK